MTPVEQCSLYMETQPEETPGSSEEKQLSLLGPRHIGYQLERNLRIQNVFINVNEDKEKFFNYSFYEQGVYDIPATIDYILEETGQSELMAVGHSVGTTLFYVIGAEKPEYDDKIKAFYITCFLFVS